MPRLKVVTPPAAFPVSLAEAKLHAHVEHDDEDALFTMQIAAATTDCEKETRRQLVEALLELGLKTFPGGEIALPRPPVSGIVEVKYADVFGVDRVLPSTDYALEGSENSAFLVPANAWPDGTRVRIQYLAGWPIVDGKPTTPDSLRWWILIRSTELYEQRTNLASATRKIAIELPRNFTAGLLDSYRLYGPENAP
jgi:uncharacterized phiE125 gp8 family phage protein